MAPKWPLQQIQQYTAIKKNTVSLNVGSDVTENSHDVKGITVIYCKWNLQ